MELEFPRQFFFSKNAQISNFMKISLLGAELFHANRGTDGHDEANSSFSQFCERALKCVTRINTVFSKRSTPVTEAMEYMAKKLGARIKTQLTCNLMSCRHTNANGSPQVGE
jgi:hypothetical protein